MSTRASLANLATRMGAHPPYGRVQMAKTMTRASYSVISPPTATDPLPVKACLSASDFLNDLGPGRRYCNDGYVSLTKRLLVQVGHTSDGR